MDCLGCLDSNNNHFSYIIVF